MTFCHPSTHSVSQSTSFLLCRLPLLYVWYAKTSRNNFVAYPHTKLPHAKLVLFDGCIAAVYVYPFSAQNLRVVIVDVVSNFLSNIKEKSQQNKPLSFALSNKLLTTNINKNN